MLSLDEFKQNLFTVSTETVNETALRLFQFQAKHNPVYQSYLQFLGKKPEKVQDIHNIPFLPIEFFKNKTVKTGDWLEKRTFLSSGTTATGRSKHLIEDLNFYHRVSREHFEQRYGALRNWKILALLPSYLEQGDSSLVEMTRHFISLAAEGSGFHLGNEEALAKILEEADQSVLLIGVSYALLDFAESQRGLDLSKHTLVETGGMKGRKKEITRDELHDQLRKAFNNPTILTEYGMTELMSQAYGEHGNLRFPRWSIPLVRDLNDPFDLKSEGSGALNVIDLANAHSCAFIETRDLVKVREGGDFEVLGRMDNSDIRGCSLLI